MPIREVSLACVTFYLNIVSRYKLSNYFGIKLSETPYMASTSHLIFSKINYIWSINLIYGSSIEPKMYNFHEFLSGLSTPSKGTRAFLKNK